MILDCINENGVDVGYKVDIGDIKIGALVRVRNFGGVYPSWKSAFKRMWGTEHDDFHEKDFRFTKSYFEFFGNRWLIKGMFFHYRSREVILHITNIFNENLLIGGKCIEIIKDASPRIAQPEAIYLMYS